MRPHRGWALLLLLVVLTLAFFGVAGSSRFSGPVILTVSHSHGLHRDDVIVIAAAVAGLVCCWRLWKR